MKVHFELKEVFPVSPAELYAAWLNSELHGKMTGGKAHCSDQAGETFSAWDNYISGKNIELVENQKIVQNWRTVEFNDQDEDSVLTLLLKAIPEGTELTLVHTNIPEGQPDYEQGWIDNYFNPMKDFYAG